VFLEIKFFNAGRVITEGMVRFFNAGTAVLNAWTPTNTNTDIPRAISSDPNRNARPSTRFLEDGSYLRLKNIMLGYTIQPASLQSSTRVSLRVSVFTFLLKTFSRLQITADMIRKSETEHQIIP
jgi:hypothetical protein